MHAGKDCYSSVAVGQGNPLWSQLTRLSELLEKRMFFCRVKSQIRCLGLQLVPRLPAITEVALSHERFGTGAVVWRRASEL